MSKILTSSGRFLMSGGRWLTREEPEPPPPPPPPTRYVYINQSTGGTISASPMSGVDGDTVTLSNSPDTNYTFNGYTVNGATLYDGNKFDFSGSDVTCSASWTYVPPPPTGWMELVNLGSNVYRRSTKGTTYVDFDLSPGYAYPYLTVKASIQLHQETSIDAQDWMLGTASDYTYMWRTRAHYTKYQVGFVGLRSNKGVRTWTDNSGISTTSFKIDGWTYHGTPNWSKIDGYKNLKLVYDVANKICYVYINGTRYGQAGIVYSPYSIKRVSIQKEQSMGSGTNFVQFTNFRIGAFADLQDAINY